MEFVSLPKMEAHNDLSCIDRELYAASYGGMQAKQNTGPRVVRIGMIKGKGKPDDRQARY